MATITTTIKEPKTFQQIQDQQRELGKEEALENLNNNIAKLIKTINDKSEKKITDDERQLKANQLALSKLQLRRAQLGLAKDEKSYSDYSVKYNSSHGIGSSIGVSQNSRDNAAAIALSAMTAGALNPVIIKELLLPPLKMMTRTVTGVSKALFSGLSSAGRRISGKTSSATEPDNEGKLHRKLDDILGAIKNKTKSSQKTEEKKEGFFSKALGALAGLAGTVGRVLISALKGALGAYLAIKLGEKIGPFVENFLSKIVGEDAAKVLVNTMQAYIPSMAAGYMIAGWRGAVAGLAFHLLGEAVGIIKTKVNGPTLIDVGADKVNELLKPFGLNLTTEQFKGVVGGFALAGPKGAVLGFALGTEIVQKAIKRIQDHDYAGIIEDIDDSISNLKKGTPFESVSNDAIKGAIAGGIIGGKFFGFKGLILGAILGAAGGFIWNRYKNANDPSKFGLNTQFDPSKLDWNIAGLDKTWSQFREEAKDNLRKDGIKLTSKNIDEKAAQLINEQLKREGKSNEAKSFSEVMVDHVTDKIQEHPLLTTGIVAGTGLAAVGISTAEKILTTGVKALGKAAKSSISTLANGAQLASLVKGIVLLWIAKGLWDANNEVNSNYENEVLKSENRDKEASEILKDLRNRALEQGKIGEAVMATVQGIGANVTEVALKIFEGTDKEKKYAQQLSYWTEDYENHDPNEFDLLDKYQKAQQAANSSILLLQNRRKEFTSINDRWFAKDDYLLNEKDVILNKMLSMEEIRRFNEIQQKEKITDEEAEFLVQMSKKIGTIDNKDGVWKITNEKQQENIEKTKQKTEEENNQCVKDNSAQIDKNTQIMTDLNKNISQLNQTLIPSQNDLGYTPYPLTQTNTAMTVNGY